MRSDSSWPGALPRAVVAEGAGARAYGDPLDVPSADKWVTVPYTTVLFAAAQVLSGWREARSAGDFVGVGRPGRVLLIAAGEDVGSEYQLNRVWAERARGRVQLWDLPDGKHTGALDEEPEEYEQRVIGFFDRRLLGQAAGGKLGAHSQVPIGPASR